MTPDASLAQLMFSGMRVIESEHLVEDGWAWLPCGRTGWKAKRHVKVPSRRAFQISANTLVMHPAAVRELRELTNG